MNYAKQSYAKGPRFFCYKKRLISFECNESYNGRAAYGPTHIRTSRSKCDLNEVIKSQHVAWQLRRKPRNSGISLYILYRYIIPYFIRTLCLGDEALFSTYLRRDDVHSHVSCSRICGIVFTILLLQLYNKRIVNRFEMHSSANVRQIQHSKRVMAELVFCKPNTEANKSTQVILNYIQALT